MSKNIPLIRDTTAINDVERGHPTRCETSPRAHYFITTVFPILYIILALYHAAITLLLCYNIKRIYVVFFACVSYYK